MFRSRPVWLSIAVTMLLTIGGQSAVLAGDQVPGLASATRFRETMGLRSDPEFVTRSLSGDAAFSGSAWGYPLTDAESADLGRRVRIQEAMRPGITIAAREATYGGAFIDQLDHGRPVFLFTDAPMGHRDRLASAMPEIEFDVRQVDHSLADLQRIQSRISQGKSAGTWQGIDIISVTVHVRGNRVIVGVRDRVDLAREVLSEFGTAVTVREDARRNHDCSMVNCRPIKGGLAISNDENQVCTSGYIMRRTDTDPDRFLLVTAGHCIAGTHGARWQHPDDDEFGTQGVHAWFDDSNADVGVIRIDDVSGVLPSDKNRFLAKPSNGTFANVVEVLSWIDQVEGLPVCRLGRGSQSSGHPDYSARQCGTIKYYSSDDDGDTDPNSQSCEGSSNCKTICCMKVVTFDSWVGDSGGIVIEGKNDVSANTALLGSHVHSTGPDPAAWGDGWYSPASLARIRLEDEGNMDLIICVTNGC